MDIEFVRSRFIKHFDGSTGSVYASPGRINLIGEHTDYNGGFVFPGASVSFWSIAKDVGWSTVTTTTSFSTTNQTTRTAVTCTIIYRLFNTYCNGKISGNYCR